MGATSGTEIAYPSGALEFTSQFLMGLCCSNFSCSVVFCKSLYAPLSVLCLPLQCMSFFNLRLLVTSVVSSKCSGTPN